MRFLVQVVQVLKIILIWQPQNMKNSVLVCMYVRVCHF